MSGRTDLTAALDKAFRCWDATSAALREVTERLEALEYALSDIDAAQDRIGVEAEELEEELDRVNGLLRDAAEADSEERAP